MRPLLLATTAALLAACNASESVATNNDGDAQPAATGEQGRPFQVQEIARFDEPWAMTFIPGTGQALVTQKAGKLMLWNDGGEVVEVAGVTTVDYGGQSALGAVIVNSDVPTNASIYLSSAT